MPGFGTDRGLGVRLYLEEYESIEIYKKKTP